MAELALREERDVRQYCDSIYRELSGMKKRIFDLVCRVETTNAEEEARKAAYFDLFDLVDNIEKKLESLTKGCPLDWKGTREEIESERRKLGDEINWWFG